MSKYKQQEQQQQIRDQNYKAIKNGPKEEKQQKLTLNLLNFIWYYSKLFKSHSNYLLLFNIIQYWAIL